MYLHKVRHRLCSVFIKKYILIMSGLRIQSRQTLSPRSHISPLYTVIRKTPNGVMDRFFKKVNQKVNFGRRQTPACPDIAILKDEVLKIPSKNQFWLHKLSALGEIST